MITEEQLAAAADELAEWINESAPAGVQVRFGAPLPDRPYRPLELTIGQYMEVSDEAIFDNRHVLAAALLARIRSLMERVALS